MSNLPTDRLPAPTGPHPVGRELAFGPPEAEEA